MGGVGGIGQAVFGRLFGESPLPGSLISPLEGAAIIDIQFIPPEFLRVIAGISEVKVEPAIGVDVDEVDAGIPAIGAAGHAGFFSDVFELQVAFIQIEFVWRHIAGKVQVGQAVVVDVSHGYSSAIVEIFIRQHIEFLCFRQLVGKGDTGLGGIQAAEVSGALFRSELRSFFVTAAGPGHQADSCQQECRKPTVTCQVMNGFGMIGLKPHKKFSFNVLCLFFLQSRKGPFSIGMGKLMKSCTNRQDIF